MADYFTELVQLNQLVSKMGGLQDEVNKAAKCLSECVLYGGTIYIMGNGGSAADASHFSGEILGRFKKERKGLSAVALTTDMATITAIANDYGYGHIFKRQLEGLFDPLKDIALTMSTSGNSDNILLALDYIDKIGGRAINLLGKDGGSIGNNTFENETSIIIPSYDTPRIQEMHKFLLHYFADEIENNWVELKGGK
jgi:D-sedoheptulose 7-phosphate isomerase